MLLERFIQYNKKWSTISESLKGRNLNSVKNRFHSLLKRNGLSSPENDGIQALIEKMKNSKNLPQFTEESPVETEEEKIEEPVKKQIKVEEDKNQGKSMSMMLNMQNQCQMYNQYLSFAAFMNNSTPQIRPQPFFGGFPNSYVPPSFGRNPGNFNMMPPFFNNGQFKCKVFQKKLKMDFF